MEQKKEVIDPQKKSEEELRLEELENLKSKAEVSSQNFERAKKAENEVKELRAKLLELETSSEPYIEPEESEEGKQLKGEIQKLNEKIDSIQRNQTQKTLEIQYPQLKDKKEEFTEFLEDEENKHIPLEKAAKLFLLEKGLLENPAQKRMGLEKPTAGGQNISKKQGITAKEVEDLRVNHPKQYTKMIREGTLKPEDIKE